MANEPERHEGYLIEDDIPIPAEKPKGSGIDPEKLPFDKLKKGQSFFVRYNNVNPWIARAANEWAKENKAQVVVKAMMDEDGRHPRTKKADPMTGYRIWLVDKEEAPAKRKRLA